MAPWRPYIIGTNLLTKFHEDPTINVAATVLTRQIFMTHNGRQTIDKRNVNARVFTNQMWTDGQRKKTNPKTSPEQSAKNVTSISHKENCPSPLRTCFFLPIGTICELI
ncbi:hypothetical protein DPMN_137962 [Dreissena polymorpha]|uniref:Uncharacterized protein n=1 Tax=Dreissena polymorpha TaxID=45954 RepID=A0A9D4G2Y8_DREPO|nr:hypothetical protein DPMN_137962 [Dreissena polymorpha]